MYHLNQWWTYKDPIPEFTEYLHNTPKKVKPVKEITESHFRNLPKGANAVADDFRKEAL